MTYKHYWTRMLNQLENGTPSRNRTTRTTGPIQRDVATLLAASERTKTPPAEPHTSVSLPTGMTRDDVQQLLDSFITARRALGQGTEGLTLETLVRKIHNEVPKIQAKHGCEQVRFEVTTVQGKVKLRALRG